MNKPLPNPPPAHLNPAAKTPEPVVNAKFDQNDPQMKAAVAEFVAAAGGEPLSREKVEIQPNADFVMPNPADVLMTEALVKTEDLPVSDNERNLFVKALLNDAPVRFVIELLGGQMKVAIRSRTLHEQRRVFDVWNQDMKDGTIAEGDTAYQITRFQQYCLVLMVERVNDKLFSEVRIPATATVDEAATILHNAVAEHAMEGPGWTIRLNAMRMFESKCAKLQTEAANPDFWKPRE